VREEETLQISETKKLNSRTVDDMRGSEKSDHLKKTKNSLFQNFAVI
jgi:hypothetical protein